MSGGRLGNVLKLASHVPGPSSITVGEEGNRLYRGAGYSVIVCPFVHQTSIHTSHIEKTLTFSSRKTTQSPHQFLQLDQIPKSLGDEQLFFFLIRYRCIPEILKLKKKKVVWILILHQTHIQSWSGDRRTTLKPSNQKRNKKSLRFIQW